MQTNESQTRHSNLLTEKRHLSDLRAGNYTRTFSASGPLSFNALRPNQSYVGSQFGFSTMNINAQPEVNTHLEKAEVIALAQLKDQIEFMRNRLKYIETAKRKNKGRIENMKKKAEDILQVRNVADELNKQMAQNKEVRKYQEKELKEKAIEARVDKEQRLQEAKEELRMDKVTKTTKTKETILEAREQRKKRESEALAKNKEVITLLNLKGTLAEARGERQFFRDGAQSGRSVTSKKDGLFGYRESAFMEDFEEYGIDDMHNELEKLLEEEKKHVQELQRVSRLSKQVELDLLSVTKSKIF